MMRFLEVRRPRNNGGFATVQVEVFPHDDLTRKQEHIYEILRTLDEKNPKASAEEYLHNLGMEVVLTQPMRAFKLVSERNGRKLVDYSEDT